MVLRMCSSCGVRLCRVVRGGELEAVGGDVRVLTCWLVVLSPGKVVLVPRDQVQVLDAPVVVGGVAPASARSCLGAGEAPLGSDVPRPPRSSPRGPPSGPVVVAGRAVQVVRLQQVLMTSSSCAGAGAWSLWSAGPWTSQLRHPRWAEPLPLGVEACGRVGGGMMPPSPWPGPRALGAVD